MAIKRSTSSQRTIASTRVGLQTILNRHLAGGAKVATLARESNVCRDTIYGFLRGGQSLPTIPQLAQIAEAAGYVVRVVFEPMSVRGQVDGLAALLPTAAAVRRHLHRHRTVLRAAEALGISEADFRQRAQALGVTQERLPSAGEMRYALTRASSVNHVARLLGIPCEQVRDLAQRHRITIPFPLQPGEAAIIARNQDIRRRLLAGEPAHAVAEHHQITRQRVHQIAVNLGVPLPSERRSTDDARLRAELPGLLRAHVRFTTLADAVRRSFGVAKDRLRRLIAELDPAWLAGCARRAAQARIDERQAIAARVQRALDIRGLSPHRCAVLAGCSGPSLYRLLHGQAGLRSYTGLAAALGVEVAWIAQGIGQGPEASVVGQSA